MINSIFDLFEQIPTMTYSAIKAAVGSFEFNKYSKEDTDKLLSALKQDSRLNVQRLSESIIKSINRYEKEVARVKALYEFDRSFGEYGYIAGVDEVGRGPLAGPIVAAAVVLDLDNSRESNLILGINDSKKLSDKQRRELSDIIKEKAVCYSIFSCSSEEIDAKGISYCNNKIFKEACNSLSVKPDLVLTDGYEIKNYDGENKFVIKGDTKSASIACASIIAKVYRDSLMVGYSKMYPQYNFQSNVGYGTKEHIEGIKLFGVTPIHRKSFLKSIFEEQPLF